MNDWAQPIGAMLIALAIAGYVVRRRASDKPELRWLRQLVIGFDLVLLIALVALLLQSWFRGP